MFNFPRILRIGLGIFLVCALFLLVWGGKPFLQLDKKSVASAKITSIKTVHKNTISGNQQIIKIKSDNKTELVNWLRPTGGPYPVIGPSEPIWIKVSTEKQRVYIMNGNRTIYTMVCSSGLDTNPDTSTPKGTFHIQAERGLSFYNPSEKEGADYWVSWKNHGEFLFHTIATDQNGNYIKSEAMKLGHKASHGCIRLAISDAKWIYNNIRYNTKVVIS